MMKLLLLSGAVIAIADPYLLFFVIPERYGFWTAFWMWMGPILLGSPLSFRARRQMAEASEDPTALGARLVELFLMPVAGLLIWYPGPISSCIGLLLLFGIPRRIIARALSGRMGAKLGGAIQIGGGSTVFSAGIPGIPGPATGASGGLKRAEGRVVEEESSPRQLPDASGAEQKRE